MSVVILVGQLAAAAFWGGVRGLLWVGQRERCLLGQLNGGGGHCCVFMDHKWRIIILSQTFKFHKKAGPDAKANSEFYKSFEDNSG